MTSYTDAHDALRDASSESQVCVGWSRRKRAWVIYSPAIGCPAGTVPEFFCPGSGELPIPLSDVAITIMFQYLAAATEQAR